MMVIFVSQCEKKALKRTRRVLDSFANRIGDNTWQTIITKEGLEAVRKLLRKTASKSTAVSCHWIRSRSRSELLWIVGNRQKFNHLGEVPVHYTEQSILDRYKESSWKYLSLVKALTGVAALLHDWGKANDLFQEKLQGNIPLKGDPIRHEWVSISLLLAFVSIDPDSWMERLSAPDMDEEKIVAKFNMLDREDLFAQEWPSEVLVIAWLILSHHRLPSFSTDKKKIVSEWAGEEVVDWQEVMEYIERSWGYENRYDDEMYEKYSEKCYRFSSGLMSQSLKWREQLGRYMKKLIAQRALLDEVIENGSIRLILHHARLALMLGDHEYSSKPADRWFRSDTNLYANTDRGGLKQKLDEHLCGVCVEAVRIAHLLPIFQNELPCVQDSRMLRKSAPKFFAWQDKAVIWIRKFVKERMLKEKMGVFAVNMASTGKGKTIANAKIIQALSKDGKRFRYSLALGLRTLTLQTGDEYRNRIGLKADEMAVIIGSKAVMALHDDHEYNGSESSKTIVDYEIDYEGEFGDVELGTLLKSSKERALLFAPVLVSTIDHLMGSVTTTRGGGHILSSLRLLSSDIVIDEIDDFSGSDLVAIGRLVYLAGMFGRKVMISSATIPPDLAEGYYRAYKEGWKLFAMSDDESSESILGLWVDEFKTDGEVFGTNDPIDTYCLAHRNFVDGRVRKLNKNVPKRKANIISIEADEEKNHKDIYFSTIAQAIKQLHAQHHTYDKQSDKQVSFGVVRMANITPCVEVTRYLAQHGIDGMDIYVMAYHSNQVLLLRHIQEKHLDKVLKRKEKEGEPPSAFDDETIRRRIGSAHTNDVAFVLVATPVEEVGRDHDFDWAVIEPSSYRSIIQLAGRVLRHRNKVSQMPNIALMRTNLKAFIDGDKPGKPYFIHPGFETFKPYLESHDLMKIVDPDALEKKVDAIPRILKPAPLQPTKRLADLEHESVHRLLTNYRETGAGSFGGYIEESWYLTAHPLYLHPFREGKEATKAILVYDDMSESSYFAQIDSNGNIVDRDDYFGFERIDDSVIRERFWLVRDYQKLVEEYAGAHDMDIEQVCRLFGELSFVRYDENDRFAYSDNFGLYKKGQR